jgi:hypothetical protein
MGLLLLFASYFSAISAKKELVNTITNFADLNYIINSMIIKNDINPNEFENLKRLYLSAKQFDLLIDDSFKFVIFYMLTIHRVYF